MELIDKLYAWEKIVYENAASFTKAFSHDKKEKDLIGVWFGSENVKFTYIEDSGQHITYDCKTKEFYVWMKETTRSPVDSIWEIFTDGACKGNPGVGGWGAIVRNSAHIEQESYGGEQNTTNNRMEMTAAIVAIEMLPPSSKATVSTDSKYLMDGITKWIHGWKRKNWISTSGEPVKNIDLWKRLDKAMESHKIDWVWVKGHNGHPENERADKLANKGCKLNMRV